MMNLRYRKRRQISPNIDVFIVLLLFSVLKDTVTPSFTVGMMPVVILGFTGMAVELKAFMGLDREWFNRLQ